MKIYEMSEQLRTALMEYLAKKPYEEVAVLLQHIYRLPPKEEEETVVEEEQVSISSE